MRRRSVGILVASVLALGIGAWGTAEADADQPLLTVTGRLKQGPVTFDREQLRQLGMETLRTTTPWTDGVQEFEGVLLARVLDAAGAQGDRLHAVALNDYAVDIDVAEVRQYPVLLAMKQNGQELKVRDRGPLWIVYPRDEYGALRPESNNFKWIWQLRAIDVQ